MSREREKRMGKGDLRERRRTELNIGVKSGRYRECISKFRNFYKKGLDDLVDGNIISKPQRWVPQDS
eukprot:1024925-Pleurochrysis_carterae.AAC.1